MSFISSGNLSKPTLLFTVDSLTGAAVAILTEVIICKIKYSMKPPPVLVSSGEEN